jgi:UDP-glucose 4-epimerase
VGRAIRSTGLADFTADQVSFLSFGRGLDTTRMRTELGLEPRYTTREAFADYVEGRGLGSPVPPTVADQAQQAVLPLAPRAGTMARVR